MIVHEQNWQDFTRLLIVDEQGSIQVELYDKEQGWGSTAWIYALWVKPEYREQGKGEELLTLAEKMAKERGHKKVTLDWRKKDTIEEILTWYKRSGYTEITLDPLGDYVLLEKKL